MEKLRELLGKQGTSIREALECVSSENAELKREVEKLQCDYRAVMVEKTRYEDVVSRVFLTTSP